MHSPSAHTGAAPPATNAPRSHRVLARGRHTTVVTSIGGGFSAWDDWLLGVWRPDPVEGDGGFNVYARDLESGDVWTLSGRPLPGQEPGLVVDSDATGVSIQRIRGSVASRVSVALAGAGPVEIRTCTLENRAVTARRIELTAFLEVALNRPDAHESHPAFSKLFVQTRRSDDAAVLVATRRPRGHGDTSPAAAMALLDGTVAEFTTDRAAFLGRGHSAASPQALTSRTPLDGTVGNVLDPAFVLRTVLTIAPASAQTVRFALAGGDSPDALVQRLSALRAGAADTAAPGVHERAPPNLERLTAGLGPLASPTAIPVARVPCDTVAAAPADETLVFFNGFGGFAKGGREYVVRMPSGPDGRPRLPPAPWVNVLANPSFGCLVSETGAGNAWWRNSREFRLTPWPNDPVVDPHSDAVYVRDVVSGTLWSPMPGPVNAHGGVEVRHGFGATTWRRTLEGLEHETTMFVPSADPVRVTRVRIRNVGTTPRRLALYAYNRWVLGGSAESTRTDVGVEFSDGLQAVLARNPASRREFAGVAFAATDRAALDGWCGDRVAFLGAPGTAAAPAALVGGDVLPAQVGPEPCAVVQTLLDVPPGETREVSFLLGMSADVREVGDLLARWRTPGFVRRELEATLASWQMLVSRVTVETPSKALDAMLNGWLAYQDVACRLWARTAFYQSGGAFGFRDQLQDAASIVLLRPDVTRAQILLHASHQFVEGDVLHWWHPPHEVGIRTRFADDLLWLPWIAAYYVATTGDTAVLDERTPYVAARQLAPGEAEAYLEVRGAGQSDTVYEHCCRAIDRSLVRGAHGVPLFGCGDWNDGMNRVGHDGRGESVWMGFFLVEVIDDFLPLCRTRGDTERAARYERHRNELVGALNADGWDGAWYRRGWYDNGAVLGSHQSDECRIDALAQAWAVISGVAPPARAAQALDSMEAHLVDERAHLVRLLTPPFVDTPNDPGYIKGYVAGVRENGGQYTHAAVWVVRALAEAGRRNRAGAVLEMLLPVNHSLDAAAAELYKVEPYVVAADVYGADPHVGRGGWTWYTGSAGWLYRVAVESVLGLSLQGGDTLRVRPRIPDGWPGFVVTYRADDGTRVRVDVRNPGGCAERVVGAQADGAPLAVGTEGVTWRLPRTGGTHELTVVLGA